MLPYATFQELVRSLALVGGLALFFFLSGCAEILHDAVQTSKALIPDDRTTDQSYRLSDRAYQEIVVGNYRDAEVYLQSALTANPTNPYALLNMGVVYEKTGRIDEARAMYAKVIQLDPQITIESSNNGGAVGTTLADLARRNLATLAAPTAEEEPSSTTPAGGATRLAVLEQLYAKGLISASEFDSRRTSAALTSLAGAPAPLGVEAAARKLRELKLYQESALLTPEAYEAERLALLDSLIPAAPAPATAAVDRTAMPAGAAPRPEAAADPPPPPAEGYRLHVASYRTPDAALAGWNELRAAYPDLLEGLSPELSKIDLGPGQGVFYRVQAGPLVNEQTAKDLCAELKSRDVYCVPVLPHA